QFRRLPYRVNFARSARTVTLVPQYARDRESTKRTGRLLANEAAHGRSVAPLLPQPCLRAPTQQRFARPLGTGLDKQIVAVESRGAVGIAQKRPLDESLRYRVVDCSRRNSARRRPPEVGVRVTSAFLSIATKSRTSHRVGDGANTGLMALRN